MAGRSRRAIGAAVLALLAVIAPLALVGSAGATQSADGGTLVLDHRLERLPDRPGHVRVTVGTAIPDSVDTLSVDVPENATVVSTSGFDDADGRTSRWHRSEGGADPTVTYDVAVNRTDGGRLETTSTGEWALFNWRTVDVTWGYDRADGAAPPTVVERATPAGEGVVGPAFAYLGPSETHTRTAEGETIRVVVPDAAEPVERPETVADALADASRTLDIGARNERVNVFLAPDPIAATGRLSRVQHNGRQDCYVAADEPLDTADNAWFHEYVHSRQAYETGPELAWFDDASAEYYAARLAYEGGHISRDTFADYVRTERGSDAVLADTESVRDSASYTKGMRVLAALDGDIRDASDGRQTLAAVLRTMNARDGTVDRAAFADAVGAAAGESRVAWLDTYLTTTASPEVSPSVTGRAETGPSLTESLVDVPVLGLALFLTALLVATVTLRS